MNSRVVQSAMFLWNLILRPWHAIRIINQFQKISHPSLTTISLDSVPFPNPPLATTFPDIIITVQGLMMMILIIMKQYFCVMDCCFGLVTVVGSGWSLGKYINDDG